jgi:hypothetical protein
MNRLGILAVCTAMVVCSCGKDDRLYTAGELGVDVEWARDGWTEVVNKTGGTVTLITEYPDYCKQKELSSILHPGDTVKLDWGAFTPGVSILECTKATIRFSNSSAIVCEKKAKNPWSVHFFELPEPRMEFEVDESIVKGKKIRHNLTVYTFYIDDELVELWRQGLMEGRWAPIELDKAEVHFPAEGGEETVTALNYPGWWILSGFDSAEIGNGWANYYGFVYATSSAGEGCPHDLLEAAWYRAFVPDLCESNQLIITVTPNDTGAPREATIEMESEDAFTQVKIFQE